MCIYLHDFTKAGLGFLNFPVKYRKRGVRAEFDFELTDGLGLMLQTGVADICQTGAFQICGTGTACCVRTHSR